MSLRVSLVFMSPFTKKFILVWIGSARKWLMGKPLREMDMWKLFLLFSGMERCYWHPFHMADGGEIVRDSMAQKTEAFQRKCPKIWVHYGTHDSTEFLSRFRAISWFDSVPSILLSQQPARTWHSLTKNREREKKRLVGGRETKRTTR